MRDSRRAMRAYYGAAVVCALVALLTAAGVFCAAPVETKMTWETDGVMELDSDANFVTVTGRTHFTYQGERTAEVTCLSPRIKFGGEREVLQMTATGPVQAKMISTGPKGQTITANCDKSVTYDRETDMITMLGNVVATLQPAEKDANMRDFTLRGSKGTLQLKTGKVSIEGSPGAPASGAVTLPEKAPKEQNGEKTSERE